MQGLSRIRKTRDQTAFSSDVVSILFQHDAVEQGFLHFLDCQVIVPPFQFAVSCPIILAFSYFTLYPANIEHYLIIAKLPLFEL